MRLRSLTWTGVAALAAIGCGPAGPSSLEGFGDVGETLGDGDGDPGDGDGAPGDGDGEPGDCKPEAELGAPAEFYFEDITGPDRGDDFPNICSGFPTFDYAAEWTAPFSGPFVITPYVDGWLSVTRGTGCDALLELCTGFGEPTVFEAVSGQTYTFIVDTDFETFFGLELYPLDDQPGSCPDGFLFDPQDSVDGSTVNGSFDFASDCGGEESPDRSFLFIPEQTGLYQIDTFGSSFDTVLHVFAGECGGPTISCNDDDFDGGTLESSVLVDLIGGQIYTIVVDGFGGDSGDYQLNLERLGGGASLCDMVEALPSQVPAATAWPSEFSQDNLFQACSFVPSERRFTWVAPADGEYVVSVDAGDAPTAVSIAFDCSGGDNTCAVGSNGVEQVFLAGAGQELVFIAEWEPVGPGDVTLTVDTLGGGGVCSEDLGVALPAMAVGSTFGAGDDHEGSCAFNSAPDYELSWTAPAAGSYLFSLEGSAFDTLLHIRDGGCDGPELGCNDDTQTQFGLQLWSSLTLDLAAGQTVGIIVDGYSDSGEFNLTITQP